MRAFLIVVLSISICAFDATVAAIDRSTATVSASQSPTKANRTGRPITKDPASLQMPVNSDRGTAEHTGRLIVMYDMMVGMRASRVAGDQLFSLIGRDASSSTGVISKYGATIRQAINKESSKLDSLRTRGEQRSGKRMPDLASMMYVEGIAANQLVQAGREFLALEEVAWVEIETKTELASPQGDCPSCEAPAGAGTACGNCGPCPDAPSYGCNFPHGGTVDPDSGLPVGYCSDIPTCTTVVAIRPSCEICWDQVCATLANLVGPSAFGGDGSSDTCLQTILPPTLPGPAPFDCPWSPLEESILIQTSPFLEHGLAGSSNPDCCRAVCFQDVTCCTISWDDDCAAVALGFYDDCYSTPGLILDGGSPINPSLQVPSPLFDATLLEIPPPVDTPGSAALALYTTTERYPDPYNGPNPPPPQPPGVFESFIDVTGFRGGGLDLASMASLLQQFPGSNGPQLPTISVAVIEPSALVNHEDLIDEVTGVTKVTVESGQTPLVINDQSNPPPTFSGSFYTAPAHGTATLGVLFANDNTIGVTGIVPNVKAFFFPSESFEQQGRLLTAMTNAIDQLSSITESDPNPGNVIVLPISENGQPLNTSLSRAAVITAGLGAGVTFVISAGNASAEVEEPIEGSEEAIVVGAVWPGFQFITAPGSARVYPGLNYCRANLSNYSGDGTAEVNVSAWGKGVCTLGYGDLFSGENGSVSTNPDVAAYEVNRLRSYTAVWGGTSASAAQVGGVAALAQALAKQVYDGQPFSPANVEAIFSDPNNIFAQCGLSTGDQPEFVDALIGNTVGAGDGDPSDVAGFPNLRRLGASVITGDFYDNNQCTFQIVCGSLLSGSQFSIREIDNKFVKARTARPRSNQSSSGLGPALFYPTGNRILDVQVIRTTELQSAGDLTGISVRVTGQTVSVSSALVIAFVYNNATNRWNFMPPFLGQITGANVTMPQFVLPACVFPSDIGIPTPTGVQLACRVVFIPFGGLGQSQIWLDQIEIMYNDPLIDAGAPCGP